MLYLNKRSPSEELASVHNPISPTATSTWHHSLDDQKMTEVVPFPQPQHLYPFGGSSHRLLAPAPEQKSPYFSPDLYREMPVYPVGYQTTSHLPRSPPEARSASVSSISSSVSHGTPDMSSSRTMSPVTDSNSDTMASPPVLTRTYNPPSSYHHTHHTSQALPSSLIPAPSQYMHIQVAPPPPMSLYPSMPALSQRTTTYPPSSSYDYHQHLGHPYPSQQSMHSYQLPMHNYQPVYSYTSAQAYPSHSAGTILPSFAPALGSSIMSLPHTQRHDKAPIERLLKGKHDIVMMIQSHLDYFDVTKAQMASRWFRDHFDPSKCPEEDKIRCVMFAEINFKRFWPNNTSSGGRGGDKDDGKHPGSFGCYHCFKVKSPENFELFRWKNDLEDAPESSNNNKTNANDQKNSATSRKQQQQQQNQEGSPKQNPPLSPSTSSHTSTSSFSLTSNPHYDPSVTRSSLAAAAAASTKGQTGNTRRGPSSSSSGTYSCSDQSPRIQETWGIRRFCIDCGIKKKFYRPGVLIELHKEKNAVWVCDCWVTHKRPQELDCKVCKKILPLSTPNRRRC
ncbi:hypothetical protein GE21DRAFT_349 [Neurospora crassa]|uniref:Uncharacterized protein n=1 Tax=Neurospora crassa (strain ATCC 24698 / 74-OR23-1A / CBS 708.71 / DSM 1257 / FGSC 987) TaxID=367110 RepID=Q7SCR0_NEUCR|nr:hypothetical protein NCU02086 [Neurospora crassa OR74A]EAA34530.1 hypothetical protein NCU02086 [Neurospora crassa OR74A]KHE89059.1 hypothetical protein GE21DRAFT_349 [Neurospora crassa]|eukprot:XP_963766.1 hypothetical protein NCU02086 [Neurospora crassa OR74A]